MQYLLRHTTTLSSVAPSSTGSVETLISERKIKIIQLEFACSSTNFTVYIFDRQAGGVNSINEVYRKASVNLHAVDTEINTTAWNVGETAIYIQVKNDDGGNATGSISVKMFYELSEADVSK